MTRDDFDLIKTVIGGAAMSPDGGDTDRITDIKKRLASFAISQNWLFINKALNEANHCTQLMEGFKWAHIKTHRFAERHREDLTPDFINLFLWEHSKRQFHLHPLVCLLFAQFKLEVSKLDSELLYRVSHARLPFILTSVNKKRLSELKKSSVQFHMDSSAHIGFEDFSERHHQWVDPKHWPLQKKQRSFTKVLNDFILLPTHTYARFEGMGKEDWYKVISKLSHHYPMYSSFIIQNLVNQYDRELLAFFYEMFKGRGSDQSVKAIDWRPIMRAVKPKHAQSTIIDLIKSDINEKIRHHAMIQLATHNYYLWEENMVMPFIEYARQLEDNKILQKQWTHIAAWRFGQQFETTLCKQLEKQLSAERSYKLVPYLREQMLLQTTVRTLFNH